VPGIATDARARILERFELQSVGRDSNSTAVGEETLSIGRDEMREGAPVPDVTVKPKTAIHCVDHAFSTRSELAKRDFLGRVDVRHSVAFLHCGFPPNEAGSAAAWWGGSVAGD
jgi:hypothetical protein